MPTRTAKHPFRVRFGQVAILCLLPLLPAAVSAWLHPDRPPLNPDILAEGEVAWRTVSRWGDAALLVDARQPDAFAAGHIPGALSMPPDGFDAAVLTLLDQWTPEHRIVVYCDSRQCGASKALADRLRDELGLEPVYVLHGGWADWLAQNGKGDA
ncbi:MAG: rhodanese-like domain-containing protein [Opitutales bacterium]